MALIYCQNKHIENKMAINGVADLNTSQMEWIYTEL